MRRLYLVRHGETDANLNHIVQGQLFDSPLNETGQKQAKAVAETLKTVDINSIYFSPSSRAKQTAEEIFKCHQPPFLNIERHPGLMEINQGIFEGMTTAKVRKKHTGLHYTYKNRPADMAFPGGESMTQAFDRVRSAISNILRGFSIDNIIRSSGRGNDLIVSHGGAIALIFIYLFDWDINTMYHSIRHENCAISIIEWPKELLIGGPRPRILAMNDTCHLKKISEIII